MTFVANCDSDEQEQEISVFLDANEEILQRDSLFKLCCHPSYRMQPFCLAQAVALYVVPLVHEACMNKSEMQVDTEDGGASPEWWLCLDDDSDSGRAPCSLASSDHLIPVSRVHPMHAEDNDKLCMECRGIYDDPEVFWPFLEREMVLPYRGWVDFVVEETVVVKGGSSSNSERQWWLCAKLLAAKRKACC